MHFDQRIKERWPFDFSLEHWDEDVKQFWHCHIDRNYELCVLRKRVKSGNIMEIGAGFYSKYIKDVIASDSALTLLDKKSPHHADVRGVLSKERYVRFDLTRPSRRQANKMQLINKFDFINNWGVLGFYDFYHCQCHNYVENIYTFLKTDGESVFKLDLHLMNADGRRVSVDMLTRLIDEYFIIFDRDKISDEKQEYDILYCRKRHSILKTRSQAGLLARYLCSYTLAIIDKVKEYVRILGAASSKFGALSGRFKPDAKKD